MDPHALLESQMLPRCLSNTSQVPFEYLPDASQLPLRCLPDAFLLNDSFSMIPPPWLLVVDISPWFFEVVYKETLLWVSCWGHHAYGLWDCWGKHCKHKAKCTCANGFRLNGPREGLSYSSSRLLSRSAQAPEPPNICLKILVALFVQFVCSQMDAWV